MTNFVSFTEGGEASHVDHLVFNLVDPAADTGSVSSLISKSLQSLATGVAARFDSDPLIDYRAQRPLMNFHNGRLVGMRRDGIVLSHATDVEGQRFLHLHGTEPDFQWDALLADVLDLIERFAVTRTYSFTAIAATTPHTRPADMVVRQTVPDPGRPVLEADFWFPASFADYVEFHLGKLGGVRHTNVAVRVPMYLAGNQFSSGAAGALGFMSSLSGLHFPLGDLEQEAASEASSLAAMAKQNEELATIIANFEREYDASGSSPGFVTAPALELKVPTMEEIGRAAEQFLAGASDADRHGQERVFDPQGLKRRLEKGYGRGDSAEGRDRSGPWMRRRRGKHSSEPDELR